jgi:hypothetical protein
VTTAERAEALPNIQTVADFVPGYEASQWYGVGVPIARPSKSSTGSTRKSMRGLPIRACERIARKNRDTDKVWHQLAKELEPFTPKFSIHGR